MLKYPGIDNIETNLVFRTLGVNMAHRLGAGFMKKSVEDTDKVNFTPPYYSMVYVIRGRGKYTDHNSTEYILKPGSVFQRIPKQMHSDFVDPKSNWAECFIDFDASFYRVLEHMGVIKSNLPVFYVLPKHQYEQTAFEIMQELKNASAIELPRIMSKILDYLTTIYAARYENKNIDDNSTIFANRACRILESHSAKRAPLRDIIQKNGWPYEWFRKKFKQEIGISPGQYMINHRIEQACNLLVTTKQKLYQIAEQLGYMDVYEFSSQFSTCTGMSPSEYRKENSRW